MHSSAHSKKLLLSAGVYVAGTLLQRGILFLSLPIYAHLLSVEDYARWSLFLGVSAVLSILFDLAWSRGTPRLYYEYWGDPVAAREYLKHSLVQRGVLIAIQSVLYLALAPRLLPRISGGALSFAEFGFPLLAASAADSLLLYVCATHRARQLPIKFVTLKVGQAVLQIGGSLFALSLASASVTLAAQVFAFGSIATAAIGARELFAWCRSKATGQLSFRATFRSNLAFNLPLVVHDLTSWLRNAADLFIVAAFLDLQAVSIYHVGYQFGLVIGLALYGLELGLSPILYEMMKSDSRFREKYLAISRMIVGATFAVVITVALFSSEVIAVCFPTTMSEAARIAPLVAAGYFFHGLYTVYVKPFVFHGRTSLIPVLTVGPTLLGIGISVVLTPSVGVLAPAGVTMLTMSLLAAVVYRAAQKLDRIDYPLCIHLGFSVIVVAVSVASSFWWQSTSGEFLAVKSGVWLCTVSTAYHLCVRQRSNVS